jgi:hypothetical protein
MAIKANTTAHPLEIARGLLDLGGGQEAMTRAVGYALVGIGGQLAWLIAQVEKENAAHEAWKSKRGL